MRRRLTILGLCLACVLVATCALSPPGALAVEPELVWTPQYSGVYASLICAAVVDPSTGWIVGGGGTILHTEDGGLTWAPQASRTSSALMGVEFTSPLLGWAVGEQGTIVHTSDGGTTWVPQDSSATVRLTGVDFVDQRNGWATGDAAWWDTAVVVHTADGGLTWAPQALPPLPPAHDFCSLVSVDFVDPLNGWAVGGGAWGGIVLHTDNGGATWSVQHSTTEGGELVQVFFLDASTGWAVGGGGLIIHTDNGGATWNPQPTPPSSTIHTVYFIDANNGWAAGDGGTILHTGDGGASWTPQTSGTGELLSSLAFADAGHGWAAGNRGVILRYDAADTAAPELRSFAFSPAAVSVTLGSATITFEARITDDLKGVAGAGFLESPSQVQFLSPSGSVTREAVFRPDQNLVSGTPLDGTYRITMTIPQLEEQGTWTITGFRLVDNAGNARQLSAADLGASGFPTSFEVLPWTAVQVTASAGPAVAAYQGLVTVKGELRDTLGALLPSRTLVLQRSSNGTDWSKLKFVSSSTGTYSTTTRIERRTYFRWSFAGDETCLAGVSPSCVAKCRASITPLGVPSIVRGGVKYTCRGLLKPQHAGGRAPLTISFYRYRSGSWRSMGSVKDSRWVNVSGATRYGVWFKIPARLAGKWRVRTMHEDADHVRTYSSYRAFVVR